VFGDLDGVALVEGPFDVNVAACGEEDGLDVPEEQFLGMAFAAKRIDEDFDLLLPLRLAVCSVK